MEVYLIRHTAPKIEKGICYGQSEIPLAKTFSDEANKLCKTLPGVIDAVYSSPSIRCFRLAKLIKARQQIIDERLLEMDFGNWEMKKWDDIDNIQLDKWMKNFVHVKVPNGESFIDLNNRVIDFIIGLLKHSYKKVAIVTHGGVIRCFVALVLKLPLKDAFKTPVNYASITKIVLNSNIFANSGVMSIP